MTIHSERKRRRDRKSRKWEKWQSIDADSNATSVPQLSVVAICLLYRSAASILLEIVEFPLSGRQASIKE